MGIYSSGNKYKRRAQGYEAEAAALTKEQQEVDFGRNLLANIREQRLAQAQLDIMNADTAATSSSTAAGASANINSTFAGEMGYSYRTSARMQQIQDYQELANQYYKKYQKQQKKRATAIQVTGIVAGALTGGALAAVGAVGAGVGTAAAVGATVGQGVGQMANRDVAGGLQTLGKAYSQYQQLGSPDVSNLPDTAADKYLNASTGGAVSRVTYTNPAGTMTVRGMW